MLQIMPEAISERSSLRVFFQQKHPEHLQIDSGDRHAVPTDLKVKKPLNSSVLRQTLETFYRDQQFEVEAKNMTVSVKKDGKLVRLVSLVLLQGFVSFQIRNVAN